MRVLRFFRILRSYRVVLLPARSLEREVALLLFAIVTLVFCSTGLFHFVESIGVAFEDQLRHGGPVGGGCVMPRLPVA